VTGPHLGDRVSALADGQLDHHRRDQLLAHLAHCDECRSRAEAERRVRETLRLMPDPAVPDRLSAALLALPQGPPLDDGGPPVPPRPPTLPHDARSAAAWLQALASPAGPSRAAAPTRRPSGPSGPTGPGRSHRSRVPALALGAAVMGALALSGVASGTLQGTGPAPVQQLRVPEATSGGAPVMTLPAPRAGSTPSSAPVPVSGLAPQAPRSATTVATGARDGLP
jgi:hypothetical protein